MATGAGDPGRGGDDFRPFRNYGGGGEGRRRRVRRQYSVNDIGNQARYLLTQFIHDRLEEDNIEAPDADELLQGTPSGPPVEQIVEVGRALRQIGDELDNDENLQRLINRIPQDAPRETFLKVTAELFSDGTFNWGRVVALFYFAYKMAAKVCPGKKVEELSPLSDLQLTSSDVVTTGLVAAFSKATQVIPMIRGIIEQVVQFIIDRVAGWIIDRGGWEMIQEHFGTPTVQAAGVFLTGLAAAVYLLYRHS